MPCQTSADFGRRGNFHYPRKNANASGGEYLCIELTQGKGSYIDFVLNVDKPGAYQLAAVFGMVTHEGDLSMLVAGVTPDALQATSEFPMTTVGPEHFSLTKTHTFQTRNLGSVNFVEPGLKLVRMELLTPKPIVLRIDRLQFAAK